ncbi:MAG TPA: phospho-N-acetylmuramoyl-pentapeptide-transferase [Candidatus Saccharimonadales bacterium]|nr:phospho-N-acetylmuramoyl-pentapeptide-transferase [Candidatus Saccharimonadales bacterium]
MHDTISIALRTHTLIHILLLGFLGFAISMIITPIYTTLAYRYKWWKKPRTTDVTGKKATILMQLHAEKKRPDTPAMAGVVFVLAAAIVTLAFNLNRSQTWLPLAAMVGGGLVGLIDDIINLRGSGGGIAGLRSKMKLTLTTLVALVGGLYFYFKLDVSSMHIPFMHGAWQLGWLIVPLFVLVVVATANAVNISDGMDGLAGGLTATAFGAYTVIALLERRFAVAGFCFTMVGTLLSYTWFNINPARFFMTDIGSFSLGTALGVVAMLTDTVLLLPVIGLVFVAEAGSSAIQILSKKLRDGKKVFRIAPIHYHFQVGGWPATKVTMRFWIIGQVAAISGLVLFLIGWYV